MKKLLLSEVCYSDENCLNKDLVLKKDLFLKKDLGFINKEIFYIQKMERNLVLLQENLVLLQEKIYQEKLSLKNKLESLEIFYDKKTKKYFKKKVVVEEEEKTEKSLYGGSCLKVTTSNCSNVSIPTINMEQIRHFHNSRIIEMNKMLNRWGIRYNDILKNNKYFMDVCQDWIVKEMELDDDFKL